MMQFFILGLIVMVGLLLVGRWFSGVDLTKLINVSKFLLCGVIGAAALFFIFTGKFAWAFLAIPALVPWFLRARTVHRAYRNFSKADSENYAGRMEKEFGGSAPGVKMNKIQALEVLGLNEGATQKQIRDTYHRLIAGIHPDHGGSNYLAAQINQAKDVLLRK